MLMKSRATGPFGTQLKSLREAAGFTQEELATIAGLSVHAVSALERGQRRRPHVETVRALSAALDLTGPTRDAFLWSARRPAPDAAADELSGGSLPLALTLLLGREGDVETLRGWLADPTARLITIVGPGGVGKTRLAQELAHGIVADGTTRVVFVALAAIRDPPFVASAIAEALGLADTTPVDLPTRARLATPTLLVLDNFEHVLDAAPLVAELLTSVGALRVLATSRAPLRLRGEREYGLGPLPLVDSSDASPADLARSPAVRLFVERIRDAQPEFRLTSANGATVTAICRRLDALPLALELAAPWIKVLTVEELLQRLDRHVLLPAVGPRDLPERQQTMNATIAWSYHLLDSDEQRAFRRFSVFPCLFTLDAAAEVLAGRAVATAGNEKALSAVAALIDKSLLLRAETPELATRPLYQMLETVRAYAGLELEAARERDEAMEGLVRYCARESARAADGLVGRSQAQWLDRVRRDFESYRAALTWLIEHDRSEEASHIASGLWVSWLVRGHAAEGLRWYERILSGSSLSPIAEARALIGAAMMCYPRGELERARANLGRALALSADADAEVTVQAENVLGHVERALGNASAARDRFSSSLEGFRKLGIAWGTGNALIGMAGLALAKGEVELAERRLDEATSVLREAGPWFLNQPLYLRALLAVRSGKTDAAIAWVRESLVCSRELHDSFAFVYGLVPLAAAAALSGDDAWAARILGARDAVTERIGVMLTDNSAHDLLERTRRKAAARLGPDRWARAYAAGRSASIDSLLEEIDNALD